MLKAYLYNILANFIALMFQILKLISDELSKHPGHYN